MMGRARKGVLRRKILPCSTGVQSAEQINRPRRRPSFISEVRPSSNPPCAEARLGSWRRGHVENQHPILGKEDEFEGSILHFIAIHAEFGEFDRNRRADCSDKKTTRKSTFF